MRTQVFTKVGDKVQQELPYSEVCMHLGVAGEVRPCELLDRGMVQIWDADGILPFSFAITAGEAGFYNSGDERGWYTYDLPDS